jgi:hypothetical protein
MRFCLSRCYDAPLVIASVCADHCDFHAVHKANGVHADLALIETVINPFDGQPFENPLCILEGDSMPSKILTVFFFSLRACP